MVYIPFQTKASVKSLGLSVKVAVACVLDHMYRRSRNFQFEELNAPLISTRCCSVAGKRTSKNVLLLSNWLLKGQEIIVSFGKGSPQGHLHIQNGTL